MLILGIDPGTATTGFGLVELSSAGNQVLTWGLIETDKRLLKEERLNLIFEETLYLIKTLNPDIFVIEKVFFSTNVKTAIAVGQAQGVLLLAASKERIEVCEYAPGTIKKMITGSGRANKKEVQKHIKEILGEKLNTMSLKDGRGNDRKMTKTHVDNAIDALAIALTHAFKLGENKI